MDLDHLPLNLIIIVPKVEGQWKCRKQEVKTINNIWIPVPATWSKPHEDVWAGIPCLNYAQVILNNQGAEAVH